MQTKTLATTDCSQFEDIGTYFKEDRESTDKYVILHPKEKDEATRHKYSIIWLHGLGDSAYGFSDVFENERIGLVPTTCKVIIPTAPMRAVTCNMGAVMTSWYDILELGGSHTASKEDSLNRVSQTEIRESVDILTKLIDAEVAKLGSPTKVFIGGFS